jgi:hypothetical protein
MDIKKCVWWKKHNWEYINKRRYSTFMGEQVKRLYKGYRRCLECGIVHEYDCDYEGSTYWTKLSSAECNIFNDKIKIGTTEIDDR